MWDEIWTVFKSGIFWQQMVQQWSKVVDNVTRALILNLFAIDIHERSDESSDANGKRLTSNRSDKSSENGSVNGNNSGGMYGNSDEETVIEPNSDKDIQSVVQVYPFKISVQ